MYDAGNEEWVFRQTGIMVAVPEIWGDIFVGRTKEGFSLNKVMIGYGGWTMERAPISDATLPILADGIKWLGYVPKARVLWYLSDHIRFETSYGYGSLDRFGLVGRTHFLQTRLQLQL